MKVNKKGIGLFLIIGVIGFYSFTQLYNSKPEKNDYVFDYGSYIPVGILKIEAGQGDAASQYNLGIKYEEGRGVTKNYTKAVYWYRKAAEQGYASAQYNLGVAYSNGEGVPQNDSKAVEWYRKAAEQGDAEAQYNLGFVYSNGEGVPQNDSKAVYWYRKAAEQGHAKAQCNLGVAYYYGQGGTKSYSKSYIHLLLGQALGIEIDEISSLITKLEKIFLSKEEIINAQKIAEEKLEKIQSKK